ncbi:Stf0 family sulfotransferase (plasmid) [Novosphingobium sp. BL-8H]|uniref:Stf0 family sulfotransferase n=1 Tax=Novosphingobium sp. BL-8H TaxID=3127640 RepID=UPI003756642D
MPVLNHPSAPSYNYHFNKISDSVLMDGKIRDSCKNFNYIFILFTNRSGSNLLASCISSSNNFNTPAEFLNHDEVEKALEIDPSLRTVGDYFSAIALNDNVDGTFCAKLSCDHLFVLCASGVMAQIVNKSTFVLIERSDKIDQAMSLILAVKRNIWSACKERPETIAETHNVEVQDIIDVCYSIVDQNNILESFMIDSMASSLKVLYEDLVVNPISCLDRISEKIGKPIPYVARNVAMKKQADIGKKVNKTKLISEVRNSLLTRKQQT